ncbi:hypothetical protein CEXT_398071 [Caerostris extrusa]|uniref:Uncharacterized protein n=1 Tax=Caerostris extrusa TaxID=172846 RepID=A0AAV4NFW1_CAEEX|nr:hypothetical protein CEXT_398071 [Caerostris extrusa]
MICESPEIELQGDVKWHLPPACSDQRQEQEKATASGRMCRRHPRLQLLIRLLHRNPAFRLISQLATPARLSSSTCLTTSRRHTLGLRTLLALLLAWNHN